MFFVVGEKRGVGFDCGRLFDFEWKGEGVGAYSRLGANSRLGAYSNKYGI